MDILRNFEAQLYGYFIDTFQLVREVDFSVQVKSEEYGYDYYMYYKFYAVVDEHDIFNVDKGSKGKTFNILVCDDCSVLITEKESGQQATAIPYIATLEGFLRKIESLDAKADVVMNYISAIRGWAHDAVPYEKRNLAEAVRMLAEWMFPKYAMITKTQLAWYRGEMKLIGLKAKAKKIQKKIELIEKKRETQFAEDADSIPFASY